MSIIGDDCSGVKESRVLLNAIAQRSEQASQKLCSKAPFLLLLSYPGGSQYCCDGKGNSRRMKRAAIDQYTPWEHKELELKERGLLDDHDVTTRAGLTPGRMPANEQEAMIGEKILGAEMATLSLEEHEQAIFDVHGIPQLLNEDPTKIEHSLSLMENEIRMIRNKHEYEHAKYLNEKYVNDRAFRLMFLRCDSFDVRLAAQRMVHHFKVKNLLFGEGDILGRPVHLSDLSDEDMTLLQSGYTQVLPTRDTAGRFVISIAPLYRKTDTRLITQVSVFPCHQNVWVVYQQVSHS